MTWDTTVPAGSDQRNQGSSVLRTLKTDLQTALNAVDPTLGNEGIFPVNTSTPQYRYRGLKGTTAQRPTAGNYGLYFNTSTGTIQRDNGVSWDNVTIAPRVNLIFFLDPTSGLDNFAYGISGITPIPGGVAKGYKMQRNGSIIGYSVGGISTVFPGNFDVEFFVSSTTNSIPVVDLTWTANNQNKDATATFASGTYKFSAGDDVWVETVAHDSTAGYALRMMVEIELYS